LPYSLQGYYSNPIVADKDVEKNTEMKGLSSMSIYDAVVKACTDNGLMVIINNHVSTAGACCTADDNNGMWYNPEYPADKFFTAVKDMTLRYKTNAMVVANDIRNELRPDEKNGIMPTWGSGVEANDWMMAAERAGNEILKYNPNTLVIVQGISFANNLMNIKEKPLALTVDHKLVYSAHVYDH
jgi:endoglucanase